MKANHLKAMQSLGLIAMALIVSCVPQPSAPPPAPVRPTVRPVPHPVQSPAPADWRDAPQTAGIWRWGVVNGRSTASFGPANGQPLASIACTQARDAVEIAVAGPADGSTPIVVTTADLRRTLSSDPARSPIGWLVAALVPRDPLLDSVAFSRGRFMLETTGSAPLFLPSWPEISRVIEDCR
jgi:hypothetical protein